MDYGMGKLADAIRVAIARPYNDAADPAEFPSWRGAEHEYRLHVHRYEDGSLHWCIEVSDGQGEPSDSQADPDRYRGSSANGTTASGRATNASTPQPSGRRRRRSGTSEPNGIVPPVTPSDTPAPVVMWPTTTTYP